MIAAYLRAVLVAADQLLNAILGGYADETLSSRAWRKHPRLRRLIDALFFWDPDHCFESFINERLRVDTPPEARE